MRSGMEECIWYGRTAGNWHVKERILYNVVKPTRENTLSAAETGIF